jgi:hypothetical protein
MPSYAQSIFLNVLIESGSNTDPMDLAMGIPLSKYSTCEGTGVKYFSYVDAVMKRRWLGLISVQN